MRVRAPADIGSLIRARRKQLGLDQRALAERIGVSRQWLVEVEKGKPRAELGLVLRTLNVLGLDVGVEASGTSPELATAPKLGQGRATKRSPPASLPEIDLGAILDGLRREGPPSREGKR